MAERKNFLLLAIGMGIVGIAVGAATILTAVQDVIAP